MASANRQFNFRWDQETEDILPELLEDLKAHLDMPKLTMSDLVRRSIRVLRRETPARAKSRAKAQAAVGS